jgi:hypothetical protein
LKITLGAVFRFGGSNRALAIKGLGVLEAHPDPDDKPYDCIILTRKQLLKLRKLIDKELNDEKATNI